MMKRLIILLLCLSTISGHAQVPGFTKVNARYQWDGGVFNSLFGMPTDTLMVPVNMRTYWWQALKGSTLYLWNPDSLKWKPYGPGAATTGTMTSLSAGYGLGGGTVTTSGSFFVDSLTIASRARVRQMLDSLTLAQAGNGLTWNGSSLDLGDTLTAPVNFNLSPGNDWYIDFLSAQLSGYHDFGLSAASTYAFDDEQIGFGTATSFQRKAANSSRVDQELGTMNQYGAYNRIWLRTQPFQPQNTAIEVHNFNPIGSVKYYNKIMMDANGISFGSNATGANSALKGMSIGTNGDVKFDAYTSARSDGNTDSAFYVNSAGQLKYGKVNGGGAGSWDSTFNGNRPFTINDPNLVGFNPGTTDIRAFLEAVFYPSQPPTISVTGGDILERMAGGGNLTFLVSWTAGRQAATQPLTAITIDGVPQTFSQPAAPGSVSGSQMVTVVRNVDQNVTGIVTTSDGKTASSTTSFIWQWQRYYGFLSNNSPTDGQIQALSQEFATNYLRGLTSPLAPSGSQYFTIAFPASFDPGGTAQIWIGGLDQTSAFNRITRSFTNASGGTTTYVIYSQKLPTSGAIAFEIK